MNLKNRIVATVAVAALALPALAVAKLSKTKADTGGSATFSVALSPAGSIEGKIKDGGDITVKEDGANTIITVSLRNIDTGIGLRNNHFQKMLGDNGKDLSLTVETAKIVKDGSEKTIQAAVSANGKTAKEKVTVTYRAKKAGDKVKVSGSTSFKYTDFYESQKYLGVGAEPPVKVTANFSVDDK